MKKQTEKKPEVNPLFELVELTKAAETDPTLKAILIKKIVSYNKTHKHSPLSIKKLRQLIPKETK